MKIKSLILKLVAFAALVSTDALASDCYLGNPGCLDPSFGAPSGKVLVNTDGGIISSFDLDQARKVAIQSDGKIVAAGTTTLPGNISKFSVVRLNTDGTLDPGFGNGGVVITSFSTGTDRAYGVVVQADGRIVVAGSSQISSSKSGTTTVFAVARYNGMDGGLDGTFGNGGKTTVSFGSSPQNADAEARSIALQSDGKILVGGFVGNTGAMARLNSNGSLDPTFGSGGKVTSAVGGSTPALAIQSDGKIVFGGTTNASHGNTKTGNDFAVTRFNPNGSVDTSFGSGGVATADFNLSYDRIAAIEIDGSNRVVAFGTTGTAFAAKNFAVARFTPSGQLDGTFGSGGKVTTDVFGNWDELYAGAIQSDGKVIGAGFSYTGTKYFFTVIRYNPDGTVDGTFGTGGIVTTDFAGGQENYAYGLAIQADGKIVAAGTAGGANSSDGMFVSLARYFP